VCYLTNLPAYRQLWDNHGKKEILLSAVRRAPIHYCSEQYCSELAPIRMKLCHGQLTDQNKFAKNGQLTAETVRIFYPLVSSAEQNYRSVPDANTE
jgi:hypothetical protein